MKYEFELRENGTVQNANWLVSDDAAVYYCTNGEGEGVFRVDLRSNDRRQITGTCQFSVYGLQPASARAKIRRWMAC